MNGNHICPICDEGQLSSSLVMRDVEYKGNAGQVRELYSVCNVCGVEQASPEQMRDNKRAMTAFKKSTDGLLTGVEVRRIRDMLGLTQQQAAEIFGGGPVAFSKYEADDVCQSEAMDKLIRLAEASEDAFHLLRCNFDKNIVEPWHDLEIEQESSAIKSHESPQRLVCNIVEWRSIA